MTWDDYRTLLVLARVGRIPAAADQLKITVSTLFRRLEKIEGSMGVPLFSRDQGRYAINELGRELMLAAEQMEHEVAQAERRLTGRDTNAQGKVRIAATELLAPFFLARHLHRTAKENPGLKIEILAGNSIVSLADGEADVALRPMRPTDEQLFGRKLSDIHWAIYAGKSTVTPTLGIGLVGESAALFEASQQQPLQGNELTFFSNSLLTTAKLAEFGGACALPMILGEQLPELKRLSPPMAEKQGELWIVCHHDLRRNPRVRVVFDALIDAALRDRDLFRHADS